MKRSVGLICGFVAIAVATACGVGTTSSGGAVLSSSPTVITSLPPATSGAPTTSQPRSAPYIMPNLVGWVLQDAQDEIQKITGNPLFLTTSTDATGQKRAQVLDRNWKVCSQSVPAGAQFTLQTPIDFGVVRVEETCP